MCCSCCCGWRSPREWPKGMGVLGIPAQREEFVSWLCFLVQISIYWFQMLWVSTAGCGPMIVVLSIGVFSNTYTDLVCEPHAFLFTHQKYRHSPVLWADTDLLPALLSTPLMALGETSLSLCFLICKTAAVMLIFHTCCEHRWLHSATFPEAQTYHRIFGMKA